MPVPALALLIISSVLILIFTTSCFGFPLRTLLIAAVLPFLMASLISRLTSQVHSSPSSPQNHGNAGAAASSLYGLDHAILNVPDLRTRTMWMNMGYWRNATTLPQACEALVEKLLQQAGLGSEAPRAVSDQRDTKAASPCRHGCSADERTETEPKMKRRVLLDLGFGCGDQTLYLMQKQDESGGTVTPLFSRYIGITIDKTQFDFAKARIDAAKSSDPHTRAEGGDTTVFCADAADPSSWPADLRQSICTAFTKDKVQCESYVLALDTLYHFRPSRRKIFEYSHSSLQAHFLAYDLFLATPSSHRLKAALNTLLIRILAPALSAPFSNFLTPAAYRDQLRQAGYADEDISIEDITEDVFPGLAGFLENRQREINALGLSGFTKWRISGWLFRWLAGGDVLRAGIIVAKWKPKQSTG